MADHVLLTTAEVCETFRITPRTLYLWIAKGRMPAIQVAGGEYRFRREDIDALLQPTTERKGA